MREKEILVFKFTALSLPPHLHLPSFPSSSRVNNTMFSTAVLLILCPILSDLRLVGSATITTSAINSPEDGNTHVVEPNTSHRLIRRSPSSGSISPSDQSTRGLHRFGSASVSRVLRINYVSSPKSYGYRRSYTEPEPLLCIGGNNECDFRPSSVQCYHKSQSKGWSGWQCESEEMNETLCFGSVHITCDDDVPEEMRWTSGERTPCRMMYTINRLETRVPLERKLQCMATHYDVPENHGRRRLPGIMSLTLFLMVFGLIGFVAYVAYSARDDDSTTIVKIPFENKSTSESSNSSGDSPIYPHLEKQINSPDSPPSPLLFAPQNSEKSVRSLSR